MLLRVRMLTKYCTNIMMNDIFINSIIQSHLKLVDGPDESYVFPFDEDLAQGPGCFSFGFDFECLIEDNVHVFIKA